MTNRPLPCPACNSPKSGPIEYDGDTWWVCDVCQHSTPPRNDRAGALAAWNDRRNWKDRRLEEPCP